MATNFNIWTFGDAHVGTDIKKGRESLAEAIRQTEAGAGEGAPSFDWEIAINVGDMSGTQKVPDDKEGEEVVRQFQSLKKHNREDIYSVCGNHDRSGLGQPPVVWWRKWIDPMGEHTQYSGISAGNRPNKIEGTWERYSFRVGNLLFLMMSDINEPTQEIGRGELGGNPGGVVSGETFLWWKNMVEKNQESIIISVHHYVLKDTTVASGEWEGVKKKGERKLYCSSYHGFKERGTPRGASYLYWVDSIPNAGFFEDYLRYHPGAIDLWLGGHTHTNPDDNFGNKSHMESRWGVNFINVCALSRYHCNQDIKPAPMSRVLTFTPGSNEVVVRCYMHTEEYKPLGWYDKVEKKLKLTKAFEK